MNVIGHLPVRHTCFFIISMIILAVETVYKIQSINGVSKCFLGPNVVSDIVSDFVLEALVLC
jgi:hypothetical protein